jgi:hypothetical protein
MKAQKGSRGTVLVFLQPQCQIGVCGQCHAQTAAVPLGKEPVPIGLEAKQAPAPV